MTPFALVVRFRIWKAFLFLLNLLTWKDRRDNIYFLFLIYLGYLCVCVCVCVCVWDSLNPKACLADSHCERRIFRYRCFLFSGLNEIHPVSPYAPTPLLYLALGSRIPAHGPLLQPCFQPLMPPSTGGKDGLLRPSRCPPIISRGSLHVTEETFKSQSDPSHSSHSWLPPWHLGTINSL